MTKEKKQNEIMVFGYVRVSTENQLENYSIEEQNQRIEAYCKAKGWNLLKTYIDGGFSGGNTDRPALKEMLQDIKNNCVDAVVVYKLDRLSRSQKDTLTLIEDEFLANDTDFISINENFDTSTPFGRAMIGILSVFAQLEKDQITERFTMGRIGRGKAGYFHGGGNAPTGYDYTDGLLHINEYEAAQVREVYDLFLSGKSINAIWHIMEGKYTTKWSATKVRNVLRNDLYIGKIHAFGDTYNGQHQPIINAATYECAQRLLNSFDRESTKTTAQKNPFRAGYLLSSLVFCAKCGARYSANHGFYKCYSRAKSTKKFIVDPDCKNDNWKIEDLDELIVREIEQLINNEGYVNALLKQAKENKTQKVDTASIKKRIAKIDAQISKLIELYQVNAIPMETVTNKANELSEERAKLEEQLNQPVKTPVKEDFVAALERFKNGFKKGDIDEKRAFVSALIERILIDGQSVKIQWRI